MTISNMIDRELVEAFKTYVRLHNKEPNNYDELLKFNNLLSEILKTYDVTYDQIDKNIIIKYKKLTNV